MLRAAFLTAVMLAFAFPLAAAETCVDCHGERTPGLVADWESSRHREVGVGCAVCHGEEHNTVDTAKLARIPTPETCAECHEDQVTQFKRGKHAMAWAAMNAMPTAHAQPVAMMEGMKGCGGCHKLGIKSEADIRKLQTDGRGFGLASCDACHTRHAFSVKEARQPQACQTCHMGFDHPQWEMYSASKHGVRALLKQSGVLPESAAAPTCQTCHMDEGNHEVRAPWGFLAVRLPLPEDEQWKADQVTILQGLGVLDPLGNPTGRLDVVKAADVARLDQESWQQGRDQMLGICSKCHSRSFAEEQLEKGDDMIREADRLMAEGIGIVVRLYEDRVLEKPERYDNAYPDLLAFHDAPTVIEQRLFEMFLKHRMRAFQGTFHANPDYALWYGWSEMVRDLTDIEELARQMRHEKDHGHGEARQSASR
jgi:hydroxylamine dehydrogenase